MQTRSLETLLKIEQVGSFAAAAEGLNMTLSAVSMQMKSLEAELGVTLFDRSFRPPKLTPVGRTVCAHAAKVAEAEDGLLAACQQGGELTGIFRIGFVATASVRLLPDFLIRARETEAKFEVETGLSQALETRVLAGQIDAAVVTASARPQPGLRYETLRSERLAYVAPAGFSDRPIEQLFTQLPFFHFLPDSGIGKLIANHIEPLRRRQGSSIFLDSVEAIMECVNRGIGFTLLPEPDIRRHAGSEVFIFDAPGTPSRHLVLATSARDSSAIRMQALSRLFM